ncbi:MAG TPA: immunoglobulin domain-containing protein [Verrucomicrobiae bacterium]|nr:immunoglobulin domain-containing protein [Verrucomicrobiae bacterium]
MSQNIFCDLKLPGGGRTNAIVTRSVSFFLLLFLFLFAASVPTQAQTTLNGTFTVTESWSVTYVNGSYGRGQSVTKQGTETGTISINNGQYTLIDHTGIPGGDPNNTTVHSISGGPNYNVLGVEYPYVTFAFTTNYVYVVHLNFFSIPIGPISSFPAGPEESDSALYSGFGPISGIVGGGSNDIGHSFYLTASSSSSLVQQDYAPQITSGPDSQTVLVGSNATFNVSATGNPAPNYQWLYNGKAIPGATLNTYGITNVQFTDQGNYSVIVSNSINAVLSSNAVLTVTGGTAPTISIQPTNESVPLGSNATLTVTASGLPAPSFQWQLNGTNIALATASSYTVTNAQLSNEGDYSVIVSNSVGFITSSNAYLTVVPAPFFAGEVPLSVPGWFWLGPQDGNTHGFGYFNTTYFPYILHDDLGWEYFQDAQDGSGGAYFYDFTSSAWFYTSPTLFPYLYDFNQNATMYYYPVNGSRDTYTSNPRWFFNFSTKTKTNGL